MAAGSKNRIKRKIVTALELPKDIALDLPAVYIIGDEELVVSNHKGIAAYAAGVVHIKTSIGLMKILGQRLVLKEVSRDSIVVVGNIAEVAIRTSIESR